MVETETEANLSTLHWWPDHPPLYDIHKSYIDNAEMGPFFDGALFHRQWPKEDRCLDFLGFKIASPLGVPAGPLLNSRWIDLSGKLGFDVVCYKTIRSRAHSGHPLPNVIYIENDLTLEEARQAEILPQTMEELSITNSFGMPSRDPDYLRKDIPLANSLLHKNQVMIVSVVGTPSELDFVQDFVNTALFAKECGAKIVEANFSCPNVSTGEGDIAGDPASVYRIAKRMIDALKDTPLIIKVGVFPDKKLLKTTLVQAARAGVRAVSGINTISKKVVDKAGHPALGKNRLTSGICGSPIRPSALQFIRDAKDIIEKERLELQLIGCGGITLPEHFDLFLEAGADIAMTATGMMWDPYIAMKHHARGSNG